MKNTLNNVEKRIARLIAGTPPRTATMAAAAKIDVICPDPETQRQLGTMLNPGTEDGQQG